MDRFYPTAVLATLIYVVMLVLGAPIILLVTRASPSGIVTVMLGMVPVAAYLGVLADRGMTRLIHWMSDTEDKK